MKTIALLLALSLSSTAGEVIPRFPYLRTQVVSSDGAQRKVRVMVWAKDIELVMKAYKSKGDARPATQTVASGETLDRTLTLQRDYYVEVLHEGKVVMVQSAGQKTGL